MGHLNIGPVYRVGQVEIKHSSKTSLIQETEGKNLQREWDFRPLCGVVNFQSFQGLYPLDPHQDSALDPLGLTVPPDPAELRNIDLAQMRIGGQRMAFEIHHCTKCKDLLLLLPPFGVN